MQRNFFLMGLSGSGKDTVREIFSSNANNGAPCAINKDGINYNPPLIDCYRVTSLNSITYEM